MSKKVGTPPGLGGHISRVLLLERLREVNALLVKIGKRSSGITAASLHEMIERNKASG